MEGGERDRDRDRDRDRVSVGFGFLPTRKMGSGPRQD